MTIELLNFHADWCGPCHQMEPIMAEIKTELDGKVKFTEIDIDKEPQLAEKYQVMSIPNYVILKDGKIADQLVGMQSKQDLISKLS